MLYTYRDKDKICIDFDCDCNFKDDDIKQVCLQILENIMDEKLPEIEKELEEAEGETRAFSIISKQSYSSFIEK